MRKPLVLIIILSFCFAFKPVRVYAQINADFSATPTSGCAPLTGVQFTDLSTGNPSVWNWGFGNGNTSTQQNPTASYANAGTYTVTLTISNGTNSDTETKIGYITVFKKPIAQFTYSPLSVCVGNTVTFTDNSILGDGPIVSWNWDFGDGNTQIDTTGSATHAYTFDALYPASLIITDSHGCESTANTSINVTVAPVASFTGFPLNSCSAPHTVSFINTSSAPGAVTYLWKFGDGTTSTLFSPTHTYTALGSYTVTLLVTQNDNCLDSVVMPAYVIVRDLIADFYASDSTICVNQQVQFFETSIPATTTRTWDFGDGSPLSSAVNPTHVYTTAGSKTVKLYGTDAFGCQDTIIKTSFITVNPQPVSNFNPDSTLTCLLPLSVTFQNTSQNGLTWLWNFGDGQTSTLQNPVHIYNSQGNFIVSLIATNQFGCSHTSTGVVQIVPPIAFIDLIPDSGCAPLTVQFISNSTSPLDAIANYTWNFGPGQGSPVVTTTASTIHTYNTPGIYPVSLIIQTQLGCRDTVLDTVYVGIHLTPSFTFDEDTVCYGDPIQFTMDTTQVTSFLWIFGDGGLNASDPTPIHIYGDTGTFTVSLVVCNLGCCDTLVMPDTITILPPRATFSISGSCSDPYTLTFTNSSAGSDSSVWDFGDGTVISSNASPITHTYTNNGPVTILLVAYNFSTGCQDSMLLPYIITDPISYFEATPTSGCYPLTVAFTDTSQDASAYHWDFGDGVIIPIGFSTASHTYSSPGYYTVTHIITDIHGCKDTLVKNQYIHVYGPVAAFYGTPLSGCRPFTTQFTDTTASEYPVITHIWNFGDGTIDTIPGNTIGHTYVSNGSYQVTLTVIDSLGCRDSLILPNYVLVTFPLPSLLVDTFACLYEVLSFNAIGSSVYSPGTYFWQFGDGDTITTPTGLTTHAYNSNGIFNMSLTITDANGCDTTINKTIYIESPVANFYAVEDPSCGYNEVLFINTSSGTLITSAYWQFGDGAPSVVFDSVPHNYTYPGYFTVTLIVTNAAGCKDTLIQDSLIVVPGPIGSFTFAPTSGCNPLEVTFTGTSLGTIYYDWDFGDGHSLLTNDSVVTHTYFNDTTVTPYLFLANIISNDTCRVAYSSGTVYVYTDIGAQILADNDTTEIITITNGEQVVLSVNTIVGSGGVVATYLWSPPDGLSCTNCPNPVLTGTGYTGYYYVEVTDAGGCRGLDSVYIQFIPCDEAMTVPNVFTPNNDGVNDMFEILHPCPDGYQLVIYNRWGQKIYETSNTIDKWDGRTSNGKYVPSGTYYWIISTKQKSLKGFVQLIRK